MPLVVGYFFDVVMKEDVRVRITIGVWVLGLSAILILAMMVLNGDLGSQKHQTAESSVTLSQYGLCVVEPESVGVDYSQLQYIDDVAQDMLCDDVVGVAVAVISRGELCFERCYGDIDAYREVALPDAGAMLLAIDAVRSVEMGAYTFDEAVARMSQGRDSDVYLTAINNTLLPVLNMTHTRLAVDNPLELYSTLKDLELYAAITAGSDELPSGRVLSAVGAESLLSTTFGWSAPTYDSLLSSSAVEYCSPSAAIVVDKSLDVAILFVVDSDKALQRRAFEKFRSRVASIVAASATLRNE